MGRSGRLATAGVAVAVLSGGAATGVVFAGGKPTRDRVALRPAHAHRDKGVERRIDELIRKMTLEEKLNQLTLISDGQINDTEAAKPVGGVFSLTDPAKIDHYQRIAVEQSRLHIPILFAFDTIHGFRTVFPIPLATASSFDPGVAAADHSIGAAPGLGPGRAPSRPPNRRRRIRRGRPQADLQPDGRRLARAALGAHLRG